MIRHGIAVALHLLLLGCIGTPALPRPAPRPDPSTITRGEILSSGAVTALDAVLSVRPDLLRSRAPRTPAFPVAALPVVYVDLFRAGGVEALRTLPASEVEEIRYLRAMDATTRFGTGHAGGALLVRTRAQRR